MKFRISVCVCVLVTTLFCGPIALVGQEVCVSYKLVPQTTFRSQPVTVSQLVNETIMESQQVTTYKPVWTREKRERRTTVLKPVVKTSEREERYLVRRPIVETSYKERQIQETSYETVTEMREQRWLVEKPVVETEYREEKVIVRKPVTSTMMQTENVTTLKPVTVSETQYVPGVNIRNDLVLQSSRRNRLRWLKPGTYVDPISGQAAFRGRGLHWVPDQQLALQPTLEPTLIPQQVARTTYTSETVQVQKPVQVTQYVEQIETRKVPVQVSRTSREIQVTKTPVTVQKPVTKIRTERVPFQEVKYREEILVRRVPVTETSYQRVEQVEPYEVEVCQWVAETKEIKVPRTVTRRVDYSINQVVPQTVVMRVPVDAWGNVVGAASLSPVAQTQTVYRYPIAERIVSAPVVETYKPLPSTSGSPTIVGEPIIVRKLRTDEYLDEKPNSVLVPETQTDADNPNSETVVVKKPTLAETDEGDSDNKKNDSKGGPDSVSGTPEEPSATEQDDDASKLTIDSSDSADIDSRPRSSEDKDGQVDIPLSGSN